MLSRRSPNPNGWVVPALTFAGTTAATFGALWLAGRLRRPEVVYARRSAPVSPPPPPDDDLLPWEREAMLGGEVDDGDPDDPIGEPTPEAPIIGEGSPTDLCHPIEVPEGMEAGDPWAVVCVADPLSDPEFAPRPSAAPFAVPVDGAVWPISEASTNKRRLIVSYWTEQGIRGKWGRYFAASRSGKKGARRHAGIDLFGNVGDAVLAPEAGRVIAVLPFTGGTWAVYVRMSNDQVANLGEVQKFSWREFDVRPGVTLAAGQPVARIALQPGESHMVHYEMYDGRGLSDEELVEMIRGRHFQWYVDDEAPPERLLDPSAYLVDLAAKTYRAEQPKV